MRQDYLSAALVAIILAGASLASCSSDSVTPVYDVTTVDTTLPDGVPSNYTVKESTLRLTELNTGAVSEIDLTSGAAPQLPAGTYNYEARMLISYTVDGTPVKRWLRAVGNQVEITATSHQLPLSWFFFNPSGSLVFGEIFVTGTLNAKGTTGLYDSYFTIYNNTDETLYADGLAIVESKLLNSAKDEIVTPEAARSACFTVGTVYVIPGNGTDVPVAPGESIKIVDQAIDWSEQVADALDHRDADFEWYDEVTTGTIRDTDNPSVANLDKWYSYSATIWLPSQQCNRSYALVRFPAGMTADTYLADYKGDYTYISATTGAEMAGTKCYRIPLDWILDGVNLCPTSVYTMSSLDPSIDMSYAAISENNNDKNRFGRKFARRVSGLSPLGNTVLMDTDDSARDFEILPVK